MDGRMDGWMDGSVGQFGKIPVRQRCLSCLMRAVYLAIPPPELRMDGWTDGWRYRCICVCINMYTVVGGESGGELEWTSYGVINV